MSEKNEYKFEKSTQEIEPETGANPSRRNMLRTAGTVGGSALVLPGLASASTTNETSSDETPDWLTIGEENEVELEAGEIESEQVSPTEPGQVTSLDHNDEHLELDTDINAFGFTVEAVFEHWAGSCEWEGSFTVQGQTFTTGRQDDCDAKYELDFDVGLFRGSTKITTKPLPVGITGMDEATYSGKVEAYNPFKGWQSQSFDFTFHIPGV